MLLNREALLKPLARKSENVTLPIRGGEVTVQAMTAGERALFEASGLDSKGDPIPGRLCTFRQRLAIATVIDDAGNKMFTADDLPALTEWPAGDLDAVVDTALRLSRMRKEDVAGLKDMAGNCVTPTV